MLKAAILSIVLAALPSVLALVSGVDSSTLVSESTYAKAKGEGFTKAIIRAYEEACSVGGELDPNFVSTYNNARAAGITNIDVYWFPCTGSGNNCKSFATQIAAIGAAFNAHKMNVGTIWIDLETSAVCGAWNYGTSGNLSKAKSLIAAAKASGFNFGIYSSPGEWGDLFGSHSVVLDNAMPLWFATYDDVKTLTMKQPFGGWKSAVGNSILTSQLLANLISTCSPTKYFTYQIS